MNTPMKALSSDTLERLGDLIQVNLFCNTAYATDLVICCLNTDSNYSFQNEMPILWQSKYQNIIKHSVLILNSFHDEV
jgi:hypothetical protein